MIKKIPELWLGYVNDDFKNAKVLLDAGIFNMVCFHSQQSVEKLRLSDSPHKSSQIWVQANKIVNFWNFLPEIGY